MIVMMAFVIENSIATFDLQDGRISEDILKQSVKHEAIQVKRCVCETLYQ